MQTIQQKLDDLIADFELLGSGLDQLEYVRDFGRDMPSLPLSELTDENKVRGCSSQLWMISRLTPDGRLEFQADSDAILSKGLAGIIIRLASGHRPSEILGFDFKEAFERLGLPRLSVSRASGLAGMASRVKEEARRASIKPPGSR